MRFLRTMPRLKMPLITFFVISVFSFETIFATRAEASLVCAGLFVPAPAELPTELALLFQQLAPKTRLKFEARFERRDEVSAEREASRLIAKLLIQNADANLKLKPIVIKETRADSIKSLLNARLDVESNRIQLENRLLEIGYSEGSQDAQVWREFRIRHASELAVAKNWAINAATIYLVGLPLFLTKIQTARFSVTQADRKAWPEIEQKLRIRIGEGDPELTKRVKYEIAIEFVRRMAAIAVLAILTDEFLNYLTPKWALFKMKVRGSLVIESRERLESQALENWKDIDEAFTGKRPSDDAPETEEIRARIRASSRNELWLHLHEGGPLSEPATTTSSAPAR